jgi:hypothetical protein
LVALVVDGHEYRIPRNWIVTAALTARPPNLPPGPPNFHIELNATYPELDGVTRENLRLYAEGVRFRHEDWTSRVVTIKPERWMKSPVRIPEFSGQEISEDEAIGLFQSGQAKTRWFNGDGSAIIAYNDYGFIIGWMDVVEIDRGIYFSLYYGWPLVRFWREIRLRTVQSLRSFLVV